MAETDSTSDGNKLTAALDALRSADVLTQNEGVAAAIQIGEGAVPGLLALLDEAGVNRAQVMYALAQIGDARAGRAFLAGLKDRDERVRAYAAQGLVRIGHPEAMAACLQTLNDAPDELHLDRTPAVEALGGMGLKPIPSLLDLLMSEDRDTRMHAQRALESIAERRHGFRPGYGFPDRQAEEAMRAEWRANGDYQFDASQEPRAQAVAKWRQWLQTAAEAK
jgi:HEAT repeat protein